ncbi:MAG: A/G-specific adenine glycosylase [Planctomycetota bacterium]
MNFAGQPSAAVRDALIAWYADHQRDLPWRRTSDPYAVWVSEIMLQQTRVSAAIPYYQRWMERFPDVAALARADLDEVLKLWEGLGYYSRARNLHKAARQVLRDHDGRLPATAEELQALPGVGRYTAGAIASIAFGLDEPVLDGNVVRVLSRVFRIEADPRRPAVREELWSLARGLIPPGRAGQLNQAIMDLGATLCLPRKPLCGKCPLHEHCAARMAGVQHDLPRKAPKQATPHHTIAAAVVRRRGRILIDRRPEAGLLGGLWEFPGGKQQRGETLEQTTAREVREEVGIRIHVGEQIAVVKHAYSHFRITLHAFQADWVSGQARAIHCDAVRWVWPSQLRRYAFPKANQAILDILDPPQ